MVHSADDELLMKLANKAIVTPSEMVTSMAQFGRHSQERKSVDAGVQALAQAAPASATAQAIAKSLAGGSNSLIY
jgi:hypothetical protein